MEDRTCRSCGEDFTPRTVNQRFCSKRCSRRHENQRYRSTHSERAYCKRCGIGFQRSRGQTGKLYCSTSCQYEHRSQDYRERGVKPPPGHVNDRVLGNYYDQLRADPCAYCAEPAEVIDHIDPRSAGGANHWENYTAACATCNSSKSDKPLLMFLGWRRAATEFDMWRQAAGNDAGVVHKARAGEARRAVAALDLAA